MAKHKVSTKNMFLKTDGWQNCMTGAGKAMYDNRVNTKFTLNRILDRVTLTDMYRGEGLARKIVDIPANDMVRAWFHIEGDTENLMGKYLNKTGFRQALKSALRWSRLYGGSLIFMGIDDGSRGDAGKILEKPLEESRIKKVGFFRVYDRHQITWSSDDIDDDPRSSNYGKPRIYTITPLTQVVDGNGSFRVHHSRVLRFEGGDLPEREAIKQQGWHDSCLQPVFSRLRGLANSIISSEAIINEFTVGVLTIQNLQDLIAAGKEDLIVKRMNQIAQSKHVMNTMLVDKDEDFTRISSTVNGIKDLLEFMKDGVSAVSGIPQIKLFGEQSKGLGAEASGNIRLYYDDIAEAQEEDLRPQIERVTRLCSSAADFGGKLPKEQHLVFNSLWQEDVGEVAKSRLAIAQADEIYMKAGAVTPEEVAQSRFGGATYSVDILLDPANDKTRKAAAEIALNQGKTNGEPGPGSSGKGKTRTSQK